MGWLENAIRQRMPATLGVEQFRETLGDGEATADEMRRVLDNGPTSRTGE
jgi:hypothetical protein